MDSWHSFPSVYNLGHKAVETLFMGPVLIEEKVDGSQFSFGRFGDVLRVRSKGKEMVPDAPEKMFRRAVDTARELFEKLQNGWAYRGEYLEKPKHNTLAYNRVPERHVILFDINAGGECYLSYDDKAEEAKRIGLEVVPRMYEGIVESADEVRQFLERQSVLGGQKVEGVVIKNYARFGPDKKALMGKFVSEAFKEIHGGEWRKNNPPAPDAFQTIILALKTPARWEKSILHLRERGEINDSPQDIGPLLKELGADLHKECADYVRDELFKWAWPRIQRGVIAGFPEWYKNRLLENQFRPQIGEDTAEGFDPELDPVRDH